MTQGFVRPEFLVETGWLARHLGDPGVRVLDCTTHLPPLADNSYYTVRPGRTEFLEAHIPGSAFVDMDHDVADTSAPFHFMLPSGIQFAEAMSALGISNDTLVVSYSSANHWWAARMWWMLRVFGHEHTTVLNGGLQKWRKENRSSLSYLKRFPIDVLKIDRSFIRDLPGDSEDAAITRAIIAMAHSLKLKVVAEGVEKEDQLVFLRQLRCDLTQGYLISPPVNAQDFLAILDRTKPAAKLQPLRLKA